MSRKMKDSGIEWIGKIPEGWEVRKIKYLQDNNCKDAFVDGDWIESPYIEDDGIRYLTTGNIGDGVFKEQGAGYISFATFRQLNCKYAYPNDLIISRLNAPYGRSCLLNSEHDKYVIAVDNVILRPTANKKFICFVTQCMGYQKAVEDKASGTTMKRISRINLGNVFIPLASKKEQQHITNYLDKKCSEIDSLADDIQKQIEILEQYKKSLITETVTKGLDPNVKMKDSGIEWIGEIPEEWEVISCKFCFAICNGSDPATKHGDTPVYGSGSKSFKTCEEYKDGPTVLLGRKGTVNIPQWIEGKYWNVDTAFDVKPKGNYNLRLFFYVAICFDYEKYSTQTALPSMTQADYNGFKLPYMSREEQQHIASYLDSKSSKIDELIRLKNQQLETLAQYKKSLIYEYVTGKKEVI